MQPRVFARHMPKYIPGHPTMIVQAMPGAGGARAASSVCSLSHSERVG